MSGIVALQSVAEAVDAARGSVSPKLLAPPVLSSALHADDSTDASSQPLSAAATDDEDFDAETAAESCASDDERDAMVPEDWLDLGRRLASVFAKEYED
eukprot:CAMPEP_0171194294 /NCGR_PEP_ID=MMETSP0790-20130122/20817_1 /TAXON_ID=2925 /ORGANISM="Alexandrium catenella, Strain OF101" /LENGTH=98 /DNA_ID=CAMNT_0011659491 /DNA_START=178 /DNA_END=474 /DNA_ORIENTATION=-